PGVPAPPPLRPAGVRRGAGDPGRVRPRGAAHHVRRGPAGSHRAAPPRRRRLGRSTRPRVPAPPGRPIGAACGRAATMMPRPRAPALRACAAAVLLAASHAAAHAAQPSAGTPEVAVRLEPGRLGVAPGEAARIALRLEPTPGWQGDAPDPGDVGLPLRIEWEAPDGVHVTPLAWPAAAPLVVGGWSSLVYSEAMEAQGEIRVAADAEPGTRLRVAARLTWGVCREVCRPQSARLVVEVDVVPATRAASAPPARHD